MERRSPVLPPHADGRPTGDGIGLLALGDRPIERGDPLTTAFGIWGALELPGGISSSRTPPSCPPGSPDTSSASSPRTSRRWPSGIEALHVGQVGGALHEIVDRHLGDPFFGIFLNPGHQLHLDESVNSPVFARSTIQLRSGMALQCDIIPATGTAYSRPTSRTAGAGRRVAASVLGQLIPRRLGPHPGSPALHRRDARHRPAPRGAALLQPRRAPSPVPAEPGPGDGCRQLHDR